MGSARHQRSMDLQLSSVAALVHGVGRDTPWNDPGSSHMEEMEPDYRVFSQKFPVSAARYDGPVVSGMHARWWMEEVQVEDAMRLDCVHSSPLHSADLREDHSRRWEYTELGMKRAR